VETGTIIGTTVLLRITRVPLKTTTRGLLRTILALPRTTTRARRKTTPVLLSRAVVVPRSREAVTTEEAVPRNREEAMEAVVPRSREAEVKEEVAQEATTAVEEEETMVVDVLAMTVPALSVLRRPRSRSQFLFSWDT